MSSKPAITKATGSVRGIILALWTLLFAGLLAGCSSEPAQPASTTNPLLYEIAGADGEVEGWMLGTIHLLPDGTDWRTQRIDSIADQADLLVVEVADLDQSAISRLFTELGVSADQPDITVRVAPSKRPALLAKIEQAGLSPEDFHAIETWAAALMLAQGDAVGSAENGVDRAMLKDFVGRPIIEFEGASAQLAIFDRLAEEDQRVLLTATIANPERAREDARELVKAWLAGDVAMIENLTNTGAMEDTDVRNALLVNRNDAWIRKLVPILRKPQKPLIAVGAAHLVGPDGLPALLEQRGFTVKRLNN